MENRDEKSNGFVNTHSNYGLKKILLGEMKCLSRLNLKKVLATKPEVLLDFKPHTPTWWKERVYFHKVLSDLHMCSQTHLCICRHTHTR